MKDLKIMKEVVIRNLHENHKHSGKIGKAKELNSGEWNVFFEDGLSYVVSKKDLIFFNNP